MVNIDLSQFRALFNQTALEYVGKMKEQLVMLEKNPAEASSIAEIYISAHSLKSQCLMMGYPSLASAALELEKLFRSLKDTHSTISQDQIISARTLISSMTDSLHEVIATKSEKVIDSSISTFQKEQG